MYKILVLQKFYLQKVLQNYSRVIDRVIQRLHVHC
jgi:hypothetical protein